jgi:predicted Ser/Thr protein kinase
MKKASSAELPAVLDRVSRYAALADKAATAKNKKKQPTPTVPAHVMELAEKLLQMADDRAAIRDMTTDTGLRKVAAGSPVHKCAGSSSQVVGTGNFGSVYLLDKGKRVAKVQDLTPPDMWHPPIGAAIKGWKQEAHWAGMAGHAGIGPEVHDAYVCMLGSQPHGVIVMDRVNGVKLSEWRATASEAEVRRAEEMALAKAARLHGMGVFHGDMHAGNVLVVAKKRNGKVAEDVFIVDYGFAASMHEKQQVDLRDMRNLQDGRQQSPRARARLLFVARTLMADGTLRPAW